ncbi:MAG: hypothetical protein JSR76_02645 [Verrucomicrobia bacterium]|nr:hypothetical protein [Verrucomicrobiota bacterium]
MLKKHIAGAVIIARVKMDVAVIREIQDGVWNPKTMFEAFSTTKIGDKYENVI